MRSKTNYLLLQSLKKRNEGTTASKKVAEDIAWEFEASLRLNDNFEPESVAQSAENSNKKPRLDSDVCSDLDNTNLPDDPNLDLRLKVP